MNISIFGLGYVGAVSSACFANNGNRVIGVDISPQKVKLINKGKSPIIEEGLEELIKKGIKTKKLLATTDEISAILNSDISIVCVGTPSLANGDIDLSYIHKVCIKIGVALKAKKTFHTIVIRSTVSPGTIRHCVKLIEESSGKRPTHEFGMASNPEFLREGTAVKDFYEPPYTIIGATCRKSEIELKKLYRQISSPIFCLTPEEAEMIKYANNNFHATKIVFANEIGNICKELGIDSHRVMEIVAQDKKLNLSPYYLKPGFAFGGSCLPKDVRALTYKAHHLDLKIPMLSSLLDSNEYHIQRALRLIYNTGKKKIGVLGFAFKAGTDDLRESPMVTLIEMLIGKNYKVRIYDNNVFLAKLLGKNKEFIEQRIPHISKHILKKMEDVIKGSDIILIGNKSPEFSKALHLIKPTQTIIDLVRVDPHRITSDNYVGICW
ncbi:MAG: GDP-mannose dehydrogenase [Bacteroidetes bacterium RIFCSPLOWO2_12_FULL_37_12]|nr:MAG: GDP-mannose dehydrogenase [Bacteroidetes bacterium RIFCSPLOWO2_12_FULL_37_12]